MKRLVLMSAAAALALMVGSPGSAAPPQLRLTALRSVEFPHRAYVLTTPKPLVLDTGRVRVRENGDGVSGATVVPPSAADRGTFGVILVLDASNSMRGRAIVDAVAAARVFTRHRAGAEAVGLITFNKKVTVVVRPTTDSAKLRGALGSTPSLAESTRLYDAAARAVDVLKASNIAAGSVVLLTDGRDTGSRIRAEQVAARARRAGVRVFAVGLRSSQFTPGPLARLAKATGASYSEAGSALSLAAIYRSLSEKFANEYLVRYRSFAGPDEVVHVDVSVAGVPGRAVASYRTPALPAEALAPFHRSFLDRFWTSPASPLLVSLLAALLIWYGVRTLLKSRQSTLQRRVGEFVPSEKGDGVESAAGNPRQPFAHSLHAIERALANRPWWERFKEELEIAEFPIGPTPLAVGTLGLTLLVFFLLASLLPGIFALLALGVPLGVRWSYKRKLKMRRALFEGQLADNLTTLAATLRAGHGFVGALSAVLDDAEEPSRSELRRAVADEQLGVPVEDALIAVARRMDSGDLEQVALVAAVQRQSGGNTAEVLDTVADTLRERFELRRLVRTLTAQGRLAQWILLGMPIAVALAVSALSPRYLSVLFTTSRGQVLLGLSIVLLVSGFVTIRRIVDIEI